MEAFVNVKNIIKELLQRLVFTAFYPLHDALRKQDSAKKVQELIKQGISVNQIDDIQDTPLSLALFYKRHSSLLFLLVNKANVNLLSRYINQYGEPEYIKPLQYVIDCNRINEAKLLILFGASTDGLNYPKNREGLHTIIHDIRNTYLRINKLIKVANNAASSENYSVAQKKYRQVSDEYNKLAKDESNSVFKKYYHDIAINYAQKASICADKLQAQKASLEKNEIYSSPIQYSTKQPLLQIADNTSDLMQEVERVSHLKIS